MNKAIIGKWAFIIGIVIAVIVSFLTQYTSIIMLVLFILGLIVGILNVREKHVERFLLGTATLIILGVASLNVLSVVLGKVNVYVQALLGNFIAFISAAALIVASKAVIETSKK